jgi:hypothetical protein
MTDTEEEAVGRRLLACKGFRVMRGMLDMQGRTWGRDLLWRWRNDLDVPDLRDAATLGCLLELVREAFPGCHAEPNGAPEWDGYDEAERDNWWAVFTCGPHRLMANGATEAEALVAALEAAP